MKILIATPAYGAQLTVPYFSSIMQTSHELKRRGITVDIHTQFGESLIPRGRNACAMYALERNFDKLLFIDADIHFTFADVERLLSSKSKIIGGSYPLKTFPIVINFNPLPDQRDLFGLDRSQENFIKWREKYADPETGEAEVTHIPTGFMLIDCSVFTALSYVVPSYRIFAPEKKEHSNYFDFFPIGVKDGEYRSEDWAFCEIAREQGFKITFQTRSIVGHFGNMLYQLGQKEMFAGAAQGSEAEEKPSTI